MNDLWNFLDNHPEEKELIKAKALRGYTVDGILNDQLNFVALDTLSIGLEKFGNIHYSIQIPEFNELLSKKMVVLFVPADGVGHSGAKERYFGLRQWNTLSQSVRKNTIILRIADVGFVSGSYYTLFEQEILDLIEAKKTEFGLKHQDIIFYGNSRGGTGALLLGITGNYKTVSVDPVIDREPWVNSADGRIDRQLMFDFVEMDFSNRIKDKMEQSNYELENITVIASEANKKMYEKIYPLSNGFTLKKLELMIDSENTIGIHGLTIMESIHLQLALINNYLFD